MRRGALVAAAVLAGGTLAVSCGSGGEGGYEVTSEVVSHESAPDLMVFEPAEEGPWPVVVAYHGIDGSAEDMGELATRIAGEGVVVFAPTYRSDLTTQEGAIDMAVDAECAYRFARSIAAEHGGNLERPVTILGWSLGASAALGIGLNEDIDPTGEFVTCFDPTPRPDIVVAVSGCHYEGGQLDLVDTESWENQEADVILLAGEQDANCPPSQTEQAAAEMRTAGFDVQLKMLEGADHFAPVFHELVGEEFLVSPDQPAGDRIVQLVMSAIDAR